METKFNYLKDNNYCILFFGPIIHVSKSYNNSSSIDSDSLDEDEIIDKGETILIKKKEKNTKFLNSLPMSLEEKRIDKDVEDAINRIENKKIKRFKDSCPYCKKKWKEKIIITIAI